MVGWIAAIIIALTAIGIFAYQKHKHNTSANPVPVQRQATGQNQTANVRMRTVPVTERTETGSMIYFANDRHYQADKEYRFNYKKINGAWRAYILRMPDLHGRDGRSIPTHRLWDENQKPYICWNTTITSLKDMQNISRVWADSIQEYIATGERFGPE